MRLGFAIAAFLQADVLLLDEVFAVGDENFQRKCFGVISAFKNRGGTILFVSHDAQAVERLCERSILLSAGQKAYDGPTHEAIARYRRLLADDLDPAERNGGLREWGTGEAEITGARLLDANGVGREQFLAGEPLRLEVDLRAITVVEPPELHLEVRDTTGLLVAEDSVLTSTLGWPAGPGAMTATLDVERPSLAFGRFRIRLGLVGRGRPHAAPVRRCARVSRLSGRGRTWVGPSRRNVAGRGESGGPMSYKTCPDWPELMELAPDLQFKHISVADAQLPFDVLSKISHVSLGEIEMCADLEHNVFNGAHTDPQVVAALAGTHWFEVHEWATTGPGAHSSHAA